MEARSIKVPIVCGDLTCCNYEPVGFATCHLLNTGRGKNPKKTCRAFGVQLFSTDGRVMRCRKCIQAGKRKAE